MPVYRKTIPLPEGGETAVIAELPVGHFVAAVVVVVVARENTFTLKTKKHFNFFYFFTFFYFFYFFTFLLFFGCRMLWLPPAILTLILLSEIT
jgi:hypothetical protein